MLDQLIDVIEQYAHFTDQEKKLISENISTRDLKPGEIFTGNKTVADNLGFIVTGVMRYYFIDNHGNEITSDFLTKNDFVTIIESFYKKTKSVGFIQAETHCKLIVIDRTCYDKFQKEIPNWHRAIISFANDYLMRSNVFQRGLINEDAKTSYAKLLDQSPEIVKSVPLGHIASYLGITQSTLSRLRRQIT